MHARDIYQNALLRWGPSAQLRKLQEECGELIAAVNQAEIGRDPHLTNLAQEIADVEILCAQARLILGDKIIDDAKAKKLQRLQRILDRSQPESHAGNPLPPWKSQNS